MVGDATMAVNQAPGAAAGTVTPETIIHARHLNLDWD